jgi:hypothetical protein
LQVAPARYQGSIEVRVILFGAKLLFDYNFSRQGVHIDVAIAQNMGSMVAPKKAHLGARLGNLSNLGERVR